MDFIKIFTSFQYPHSLWCCTHQIGCIPPAKLSRLHLPILMVVRIVSVYANDLTLQTFCAIFKSVLQLLLYSIIFNLKSLSRCFCILFWLSWIVQQIYRQFILIPFSEQLARNCDWAQLACLWTLAWNVHCFYSLSHRQFYFFLLRVSQPSRCISLHHNTFMLNAGILKVF